MSRTWLLLGMALAASLDVSSGVIIAHLLCLVFQKLPTILVYVAGSVVALSPDVSIAMLGLCGKSLTVAHHREITHYPLLIIPIFLVVAWFSIFWALLISLCLLAHFIDDTADPGGLAWLAPFSKRKYQILGSEKEPLSREEWLRRYYLRPTVKSGQCIALSSIAAYLIISLLLHD